MEEQRVENDMLDMAGGRPADPDSAGFGSRGGDKENHGA